MNTELTFTCCTPFSCGIKDNVGDTTKQTGKQTNRVLHILCVSLCCGRKALKSYSDLVVVDWTDRSYQSSINGDEDQSQFRIWCLHLNIRIKHSPIASRCCSCFRGYADKLYLTDIQITILLQRKMSNL